MNKSKREHVARLLQTAASSLAADIPDEVRVGISVDDEIVLESWTWTSALTRHHLHVRWSIARAECAVSPECDGKPWESAALPIMRQLIGPAMEIQVRRWAIAHELGLVRCGSTMGLPPAEMTIDRLLLAAVDERGIDVRRAAAMVQIEDSMRVGDELPQLMAGVNLEGCPIFVRQVGTALPVLCTFLRIGSGHYDGTILALNGPLPHAIMAAAPGRELGEIVRTGLPRLDERRIVCIAEAGFGAHGFNVWDTGKALEIHLVPDVVRLGDPDC